MPLVRIPLVGTYNTRTQTTSVSTSLGIVGIGVVGIMIVGKSNVGSTKDQRFINCYAATVKNEVTRTLTPYLINRPGFAANTTPDAGNVGNDIMIWTGQGSGSKIISSFRATNSRIFDGTSSLGDITGVTSGLTETVLSGVANVCVTSSDGPGWFYPDGGSLTQITDGDFPGNAGRTLTGTFGHIGGYAVVMDTSGRVYNSDLNSISSWSGTFFVANTAPDKGSAAVVYRDRILAFGRTTMEVWENAGTPSGSPFVRNINATRKIGLINANSITPVGDSLAFIGPSDQGGCAVYMMDGFEPTRVSTPEIEAQLVFAPLSAIRVTCRRETGRTFVVVIVQNATYAYCVEEKLWHEWASQVILWHKMVGIVSGSTVVTYAISTVSTSGKVYIQNPAAVVYNDDGFVYPWTAQTSVLDQGNLNRKSMTDLRLNADKASSSLPVFVSFSDDDFNTYSVPRTVDLSTNNPWLRRCGTYRKRSIRISATADMPVRIGSIDANIEMSNT